MQNQNTTRLVQKLAMFNETYRAGNPLISDAEYDALLEELRLAEADNEWLNHIEPATTPSSRKIKLPIPMKSLDKVKCLEDIFAWLQSMGLKSQKVVVMPKFDGLSLLYDLWTGQAYSRGGADNEGQDCTSHVKVLLGEPSPEPPKEIRFVYGELLFSTQDWEQYFKDRISPYTGDPFKSPRNTIAGLINRINPSEELSHAYFYRYGLDSTSMKNFKTYEEVLLYLSERFHQPALYLLTRADEVNEKMLKDSFDQWSKQFFIDGLVIYVNDLALWDKIGRHQTSGNPKYAMAYKHLDFTPFFVTTAEDVNWKISKAGAFKPIVIIKTVDTGDCNINSPTGYNARYIFENGIGKGAKVEIVRSGGVIPKISKVLSEASFEAMNSMREELLYCPHCGCPTTWNDSGVEIICKNPLCPGLQFAKIVHFYNVIGVDGLGEDKLYKIYSSGCDTLRKMLNITREELLQIEGIGEELASSFVSANANILQGVELTKLMHASDCFNNIGQTKAKNILSQWPEHDIFVLMNGYGVPNLQYDAETISKHPKLIQEFIKGLPRFYRFVVENRLTMLPPDLPPKTETGKYKGMKICFSCIRDEDLEREITSQGGSVVNNVSAKTSVLIVDSHMSISTKITKAKKLGIKICTPSEFSYL